MAGLEAFAHRPDPGVDPAQIIERPLESQSLQLVLALGLGAHARVRLRHGIASDPVSTRSLRSRSDRLLLGPAHSDGSRRRLRGEFDPPIRALVAWAADGLIADMSGPTDASIQVARRDQRRKQANQENQGSHRGSEYALGRPTVHNDARGFRRKIPRHGVGHFRPWSVLKTDLPSVCMAGLESDMRTTHEYRIESTPTEAHPPKERTYRFGKTSEVARAAGAGAHETRWVAALRFRFRGSPSRKNKNRLAAAPVLRRRWRPHGDSNPGVHRERVVS